MSQEFEQAYAEYLKQQLKNAKGKRLHRLKDGLGHAEKLLLKNVLWPILGQLNRLYAEFEVSDFRDGTRYLDFAYIRPPYKINIEADGRETHGRDSEQQHFSDDRIRQNHLVIDKWHVLRFSFASNRDHPRMCQQQVQQLFGSLWGEDKPGLHLTLMEKEVIRVALRMELVITPGDIRTALGIGRHLAWKSIQSLVAKGVLRPHSGKTRIRSYQLQIEMINVYEYV